MQLSAAVPEKAVENGQELAPMWKAQKKLLNFGAEPALFQPLQLFGMVSELTMADPFLYQPLLFHIQK